MKKGILAIILCCLLLLTACADVTDDVMEDSGEDITDDLVNEVDELSETVVEETVEEQEVVIVEDISDEADDEEEVDLSEIEYTLYTGQVLTVDGHDIKLEYWYDREKYYVSVDGVEGRIIGTRNKEIINDFEIIPTYVSYNGDTADNNHIRLYAYPHVYSENEHLIYKGDVITAYGHEVELTEANSDGYIIVKVLQIGTSYGEGNVRIYDGSSKIVEGVNITNLESFWENDQYAFITIESA